MLGKLARGFPAFQQGANRRHPRLSRDWRGLVTMRGIRRTSDKLASRFFLRPNHFVTGLALALSKSPGHLRPRPPAQSALRPPLKGGYVGDIRGVRFARKSRELSQGLGGKSGPVSKYPESTSPFRLARQGNSIYPMLSGDSVNQQKISDSGNVRNAGPSPGWKIMGIKFAKLR